MELDSRTSTERYNPITGTPIPVQPARPVHTAAIFGGSPGNIDYMFIPPSATTRPTKPTTFYEKRRSLSRESLRRSYPAVTESQRDSDECSSISDVSECSSEAEHRERTRTNSGSSLRTRKPIARSASSRLPVSASKPYVMKRAHSFTRGTGSCVPRGQSGDSRGVTNNPQEATSTSDLTTQTRRPNVEGTSKIPRKTNQGTRIPTAPQSSRIPLKRADVNSNVAERGTERSGKENTVSKRTAPATSKTRGTPVNIPSKLTSSELKETGKAESAVSKQSSGSGIPVKGGKTQQNSGSSKLPQAKLDGSVARIQNDVDSTAAEQNIDKENDDVKSAKQDGRSTLKREGTGDELRAAKNDKSKVTRKSSIPKSNAAKPSLLKTRNNSNTDVETKPAKSNQPPKIKGAALSDNKTDMPSQHSARRELSARPADATSVNTSYTLQRSDSGYGDTDSISSREDAPVAEPGNEFVLSRENSKSKIPIMSWKSRGTTKTNREATSSDEKKPKEDTKNVEGIQGNELLDAAKKKLETETGIKHDKNITTESEIVWVKNSKRKEKTAEQDISNTKSENNIDKTNTENNKTSSQYNIVDVLGTSNVTSKNESPNRDVKPETELGNQIRDMNVSFNNHKGLGTRNSDNKTTSMEWKAAGQKCDSQIQAGESTVNNKDHIIQPVNNVCSSSKDNMMNDFDEKQNGDQSKENNNMDIKVELRLSVKQQTETSNTKQSTDYSKNLNGETASNSCVEKHIKTRNEAEKPTTKGLENVQAVTTRKANVKQSPKKPPRLSKIIVHNDCENQQELSATDRAKNELGKAQTLGREVPSMEGEVEGGKQSEGKGGDVEQREGVGGEETEEPPRRSENCMQCRMEQSMSDNEEISKIERNDPGFRQYPTFISPRKSLVMCKHHACQKNDTEIARDEPEIACDEPKIPLVPMTSLSAMKNDQKSSLEPLKYKPELNSKMLDMPRSSHEYNKNKITGGLQSPKDKDSNTGGVKSPIGETSRMISPKTSNAETLPYATKNISDGLRTPKNAVNDSRQVQTSSQPGPKGSHSPLLALSRDKKFASSTKPTEDIKTALSLEWDDTGTELSPPNFSDDDDDEDFSGHGAKRTEGDIEDNRRPSVKLMDTNEALDKLKVIQNLIMKEAEHRNRKDSEESAGKYGAVGLKKTGTESVVTVGEKKPGDDVEKFGGKYGLSGYKSNSTSNQVSPTCEAPARKISSPTIWDRITDNTISQDQTTELLNETLAKLKASPKLSSNALARRTISSRSLPGSRQASKEQLLSDSERPVYVYTSSWMNTSGKNSRGSSLSLNRSLPSSRQNLTKDPSFNGLKRSESAAGRMEKENGKRLEPKDKYDFRLSDFDEINLSDDGTSELRSQRTSTPKTTPLEKNSETARKPIKKSKKRKKSKNTAATMNNASAYDMSMEELAEGKTTCQCGGKGCVIS